MGEPFFGEIRAVSFGVVPRGWLACDGQTLPINQNQALFSLLGTTYGGNGQTTFQLPDLRARVPIHVDYYSGHSLGERGGESSHVLTVDEMPTHTHGASGANAATSPAASANLWGTTPVDTWATPADRVAMDPQAVSSVGGSQPHENMPPYLGVMFIIANSGVFPSQN